MDLLDIGDYARDARLVGHEGQHASFYGEKANPAVYVRPFVAGFGVLRLATAPDRSESKIEVLAEADTAVLALETVIGPVIPR
jgi:hypothetical protein